MDTQHSHFSFISQKVVLNWLQYKAFVISLNRKSRDEQIYFLIDPAF